MSQTQEKGSIIPVPIPKPKISPKIGDQDPIPKQDTIPIIYMSQVPELELTELNLLVEDQNLNTVVDCAHLPEHNPIPP